jgi:YesN/AraC family two-component response regulator
MLITDLVMGAVGGLDVLKKAKELDPEMMAIVLTGFGDLSSAIDALRLNADDYLQKPCESEALHFRISRCFEKLELKREISRYEEILPVCCVCKKIRDDSGTGPGKGKWMSLEEYMHCKKGVGVTSTYCPKCFEKAMGAIDKEFP